MWYELTTYVGDCHKIMCIICSYTDNFHRIYLSRVVTIEARVQHEGQFTALANLQLMFVTDTYSMSRSSSNCHIDPLATCVTARPHMYGCIIFGKLHLSLQNYG